MIKFKIDIPLNYTLNKYIEAERTNKFIASKIKRSETIKIANCLRGQYIDLADYRYNIYFHWYKPDNKQDHDNIAFMKKFILDGFVLSGILKNDNPKFVNNFCDYFQKSDKKYIWCMVVLEIS